ncbi:hypothetical protein CKAH01_13480 [Colletotrichum kahawae]|uniref:Complex 1 LYR protein domain-containing protein n=1 Tax=Colletotrichum kahawae TaxID=34407 RepID=A0AAD9YSI6_COLKA|nr:hypothetical protein CKAH01_13480 [Colletotrichum kahawae]
MPKPKIRLPVRNPTPQKKVWSHLQAATATSTAVIPLPKPIRPLHVYRHLLRATTYFPLICRPYLEDWVKDAFRRERARAASAEAKLPNLRRDHGREREEHFLRTKALFEGKRKLRTLNAARMGDTERFRKVLWLVFGKLGRRRRELMADFVKKQPDPPLDIQELEKKIQLIDIERDIQKAEKLEKLKRIPPTRRVFDRTDPTPWVRQKLSPIEANWDIKKLTQFYSSQKTHQLDTQSFCWPRTKLESFRPERHVPEKDIWGRETAAQRKTKKVRLWWKRTADKLVPPVERNEWDILRSIATGDAPAVLWKLAPRRPVAVKKEQEDFPWSAYASIPVREIERPRSRKRSRLTGKTDDGPYSRTHQRVREVPYSDRKLRREFSMIWQASSYVEEGNSDAKGRHRRRFVWGDTLASPPTASGPQLGIFEGVDARGQVLSGK